MKTKGNKTTKVNIVTLGCSKNVVDSEVMMAQLRANEVDVTHDETNDEANVVIINTCGFISLAVFLAYNTHKLVKWLREKGSYASIQSLRFLPTRILFFVATLSFLGIGISLHFRWSEYFLLSILFFMCLSYSVFQPKFSIRSIPYLKSFFIALSCTILCCALPMSYVWGFQRGVPPLLVHFVLV